MSDLLTSRGALILAIFCVCPMAFRVAASTPGLADSHYPTNMIEYQRWHLAFLQRASREGVIPGNAKLRAFDQMRELLKTSGEASPSLQKAALPGTVQGTRWVSIGPAPIANGDTTPAAPVSGRIADVAVDPSNSSHWYIAAAQGGVWETRDAGSTWNPLTDDQPSLAMGALALAPSNPKIIYAGTGEGVCSGDAYAGLGLLKSINGGTNWALLGASTFAQASFRDIRVNPSNSNILLVATVRGFAGVSGSSLPSAPPVGIYKSTDGGTNWALKLDAQLMTGSAGGGWCLQSHPSDFTKQYAAAGSLFRAPTINGVFRSTDTGNTWQLITGPWTSQTGRVERIQLALAPSNPNILYASVQDSTADTMGNPGGLLGIWRTDNAWGATPTWVQLPFPYGVGNRFWYNHALSVDPTDAQVLFLGEIRLWRYSGANFTWSDFTGPLHADQQRLAWFGTRLMVGNDGGLWSSTNVPISWNNHNTNLAITQFYQGSVHPGNPNFALGGSQDNGTELWTGPRGWVTLFDGDGGFSAISAAHPDTDWAISFQNLNILRTKNGGASFSSATSGLNTFNALLVAPFRKSPNNDDIFIAGTSVLWKTTNFFAGTDPSWFVNGPNLNEYHTAVAFAPSDTNSLTYAFGTLNGNLNVTADGGNTWTQIIYFSAYISALAFHPDNSNLLYITISSFNDPSVPPKGHLYRTTNAFAASPTFLSVGPPVDIPFNAIVLDPADPATIYVGTDIGIWKSTNSAASWTHVGPESGIPNVAVYDLEISPGAQRLIAFTHGRGAFALVSPPRVIAGKRIGSTFSFSLYTLPAAQYLVQYKNLLTDLVWLPLNTITGDGTLRTNTDTTATTPRRFYRVAVN